MLLSPCQFSVSCPWAPGFIFLLQGDCQTPPAFLSLGSGLETLQTVRRNILRAHLICFLTLGSHYFSLSGSNVLRTIVSYILLGILVVLGGNINPVPVTPSWLEAGILMIVCEFVQLALVGSKLATDLPHTGPVALQTLHVFLSQGLAWALPSVSMLFLAVLPSLSSKAFSDSLV